MAIKVQVDKMKLGFTDEKKDIYVARADRGSVIDTTKLSEEVAMDTGARPKQVKMVLMVKHNICILNTLMMVEHLQQIMVKKSECI